MSLLNPPVVLLGPKVPVRLAMTGRLLALVVSIAAITPLLIASRITPNPTGIGTHQALHMQPCSFLERTGLPCASCGMTTSFAWFARANLPASAYVQPAGFALAVVCAITFWTGVYIACTGRPIYRARRRIDTGWQFGLPVGVVMFGWVWKTIIVLAGIDGWR